MPNKATATIKALALEKCPRMIEILCGLAEKADNESVRKEAAFIVLQYGAGKPKETHEHGGPDGGAIPVSLEGIGDALGSLVKSVRERSKE